MVDENTIKEWAHDSYWNNAELYRCIDCGKSTRIKSDCDYDKYEPVYSNGEEKPVTFEDCIEWLSETGEVTFARQ